MVKALEAWVELASMTLTVNEDVPKPAGIPEICPVDMLRVNP
jgi:hypothetical protein